MRMSCTFAAASLLLFSALADAEVKTQTIDYEVNGEPFTGFMAWDDAIEGERPGVLVVHEWWGMNDFTRSRAEALAALGYTAFALDMYGSGKVTDHPDDAKKFMQAAMSDPAAAEARFAAAMGILQEHETVDADRIAAQGYCFGGAVVLTMARKGMDLDGVVSFHGALPAEGETEPGLVKARVLVYTGGNDPFVPPEQVGAFVQVMQKAEVDFKLVSYPGVQHAFTNPGADAIGEEHSMPLRYDRHADEDSWEGMKAFYQEVFSGPR